MAPRPLCLDLFCGAGGAAMGLYRAGYDLVGIDNRPQPRYPFRFIQGDALRPPVRLEDFDLIWASPPCQGYSRLRHLPWLREKRWPKLIAPMREALRSSGVDWVIENVEDAPLDGITLCGQMFGLPTYRHRKFECSRLLMEPGHPRHRHVVGRGRMVNDRRKRINKSSGGGQFGKNEQVITVASGQFKKREGERALGIDWMRVPELAQAIPPAYSEFIGRQLLPQ
jgi:DNA (cytosine-5)-methyltransferase 1